MNDQKSYGITVLNINHILKHMTEENFTNGCKGKGFIIHPDDLKEIMEHPAYEHAIKNRWGWDCPMCDKLVMPYFSWCPYCGFTEEIIIPYGAYYRK